MILVDFDEGKKQLFEIHLDSLSFEIPICQIRYCHDFDANAANALR